MKGITLAVVIATLPTAFATDMAFKAAGSYTTEAVVSDIAVAGSRAYLGTSQGMEIIDISTPGTLRFLTNAGIAAPALNLEIAGDRLYANAAGNVEILSLANADAPQSLGRIEGVSGPLVAAGNKLYVGSFAGLKIYDVANPANPSLLGEFPTNGVTSVALSGSTAYLVVDRVGLLALDVNAPATPKLLSTSNRTNGPSLVAVHGDSVYLTHGAGGVIVMNATNPAEPAQLGVFNPFQIHPRDFATDASSVYVLSESCVIALQPGISPADAQQNAWCGGEELKALATTQGRVFAASLRGLTELAAIPANPQRAGKLPGAQGSLSLGGNESHVATLFDKTLELFNTTDLAAPKLAGTYTHSVGVWQPQFFRDGDGVRHVAFLETGLSNRAVILNIADPAAPQPVSTLEGGRNTTALHINNQYAFVASHEAGVKIYPVLFPSNPTYLASWTPPSPATALSLAGGRPHLFVGLGSDGLQSLNVDNSFNIRELSALTTITNQTGVTQTAVLGDHLYVGSFDAGVEVYDISDPRAPRHAGSNGSFRADGIIATQINFSSPRVTRAPSFSTPSRPP